MINITQLDINNFTPEPTVTISECIEFTNSYIAQTKIMSVVIGIAVIVIAVLYYKLRKGK